MPQPVPAPSLPVVWRPSRGRIVPYVFAAVVVLGSVVMAAFIAEPFGLADRLGLVAFGCAVAFVLHLLGRVRVEADDDGLTVVNAVRTYRYTWPQVLDITLLVGDPWPKIDFADGITVGAMGIQGSEKTRARQATAELAALIRERAETREA